MYQYLRTHQPISVLLTVYVCVCQMYETNMRLFRFHTVLFIDIH